MKVLICGVDGYIGFPLAMRLLRRGHQVYGTDNFLRRQMVKEIGCISGVPISSMVMRQAYLNKRFGNFHFEKLDIAAQYEKLKQVIKDFKPESVVNLAQVPSAPYSMIDAPHATSVFQNNTAGLLNLVWCLRKYAPNCHITTLGCYDDITEILTIDGWKNYYELKETDKVAIRNKNDRTVHFEKPEGIYSWNYDGRMYIQQGQRIDFCVTPNHRIFTQKRSNNEYKELRLEFADDIIGKRKVYDVGFNWVGQEQKYFKLKNKNISMDDWLNFLGWYLSEGHVSNRKDRPNSYGTFITQKKIETQVDVKNIVLLIAKHNGLNTTLNDDRGKYIIWGKELAMYLKQFGHAGDKFIPKNIKQLSKRQLKILLNSLIKGDGWKHSFNRENYRYYSKSKQLADDVQEIALKCGYGAIVSSLKNGWNVYICQTPRVHVNHNEQTDDFINYSGLVWCVKVKGDGIIFVRRNGKPLWSGNTMGEYEQPNMPIPEGFFYTEYKGKGDVLEFPRLGGSFYHVSKTASSKLLSYATRTWDIMGTDIMQGVVYGTTTEEMCSPPEPLARTRFDFDECFGTMINRAVACSVIGHPLLPYGSGMQTRAYIALRDSIRCLNISVENPPNESDSVHCYRIINQFDESYSCNEIANRVQIIAKDLGILSEIKHITNPRVEKEVHYYSPEHEKLYKLGWRPTKTLDEELRIMVNDVSQFKERIERFKCKIVPKVRWRD